MVRGGSCLLNNRRFMVYLIRWVFSFSRVENMYLEVDDVIGNVKLNIILVVWGFFLVVFGDRSFIESFVNGFICICNSMYFGYNI